MREESNKLIFDRRQQSDTDILEAIRRGLGFMKWEDDFTPKQAAVASRLDVVDAIGVHTSPEVDFSVDEAEVAVAAITKNFNVEMENEGGLVAGSSILAQEALPSIVGFAQRAAK